MAEKSKKMILEIDNFKKLGNNGKTFILDFNKGEESVVRLFGKNGQGKTSIIQSVLLAVYGPRIYKDASNFFSLTGKNDTVINIKNFPIKDKKTGKSKIVNLKRIVKYKPSGKVVKSLESSVFIDGEQVGEEQVLNKFPRYEEFMSIISPEFFFGKTKKDQIKFINNLISNLELKEGEEKVNIANLESKIINNEADYKKIEKVLGEKDFDDELLISEIKDFIIKNYTVEADNEGNIDVFKVKENLGKNENMVKRLNMEEFKTEDFINSLSLILASDLKINKGKLELIQEQGNINEGKIKLLNNSEIDSFLAKIGYSLNMIAENPKVKDDVNSKLSSSLKETKEKIKEIDLEIETSIKFTNSRENLNKLSDDEKKILAIDNISLLGSTYIKQIQNKYKLSDNLAQLISIKEGSNNVFLGDKLLNSTLLNYIQKEINDREKSLLQNKGDIENKKKEINDIEKVQVGKKEEEIKKIKESLISERKAFDVINKDFNDSVSVKFSNFTKNIKDENFKKWTLEKKDKIISNHSTRAEILKKLKEKEGVLMESLVKNLPLNSDERKMIQFFSEAKKMDVIGSDDKQYSIKGDTLDRYQKFLMDKILGESDNKEYKELRLIYDSFLDFTNILSEKPQSKKIESLETQLTHFEKDLKNLNEGIVFKKKELEDLNMKLVKNNKEFNFSKTYKAIFNEDLFNSPEGFIDISKMEPLVNDIDSINNKIDIFDKYKKDFDFYSENKTKFLIMNIQSLKNQKEEKESSRSGLVSLKNDFDKYINLYEELNNNKEQHLLLSQEKNMLTISNMVYSKYFTKVWEINKDKLSDIISNKSKGLFRLVDSNNKIELEMKQKVGDEVFFSKDFSQGEGIIANYFFSDILNNLSGNPLSMRYFDTIEELDYENRHLIYGMIKDSIKENEGQYIFITKVDKHSSKSELRIDYGMNALMEDEKELAVINKVKEIQEKKSIKKEASFNEADLIDSVQNVFEKKEAGLNAEKELLIKSNKYTAYQEKKYKKALSLLVADKDIANEEIKNKVFPTYLKVKENKINSL